MADEKEPCECVTHCYRRSWQRCQDLPPIPTLHEALATAANHPDGPQPTMLDELVKTLAIAAARIYWDNLQRYPDILDPDDPRLMEIPPPPEPPPPAPRWVYFMADGATGLIKVGISVDVKVRKTQVARTVGSKLALVGSVSGNLATETAFHRLLARHHAHGEWFRRGPWFDQVLAGLDAREDADALLKRIAALGSDNG